MDDRFTLEPTVRGWMEEHGLPIPDGGRFVSCTAHEDGLEVAFTIETPTYRYRYFIALTDETVMMTRRKR